MYKMLGCANPPLVFNLIIASISCGNQYVTEHWEIAFLCRKIFLGVPQRGSTSKKVEFQHSRNNMLWVV